MDDEKIEGRLHGEQPDVAKDSLGPRLFYMVLIWFMLSLGQTVLGVATAIQFVIMLVNSGNSNERLADFGTDLGIWMGSVAQIGF